MQKKMGGYWDFDIKSWIVDFFTRFTWEKTPQNNFPWQNFSVENNYFVAKVPIPYNCLPTNKDPSFGGKKSVLIKYFP